MKVGGAVVEDTAALERFLARFTAIDGKKVLVHGGGRLATDVASRIGIKTTMVQGRRITDGATLRVVTMVYGGLVNKGIVAKLQSAGVNAIGLSGADMNIITSKRRPVRGGIDYGFVGDVTRVDGDALARLLMSGITPVIAPLTHDGAGTMLNTNADTIASEVAQALAKTYDVTLTYCFEKAGVLGDPHDNSSVIPVITRDDLTRRIADGSINGGMIPKMENALAAMRGGVNRVIITSADSPDGTGGTEIHND